METVLKWKLSLGLGFGLASFWKILKMLSILRMLKPNQGDGIHQKSDRERWSQHSEVAEDWEGSLG